MKNKKEKTKSTGSARELSMDALQGVSGGKVVIDGHTHTRDRYEVYDDDTNEKQGEFNDWDKAFRFDIDYHVKKELNKYRE